jgi:UDP-N-acetylglucosamine/UDP-N-acetylgalactosamine diphosphorylase
MQDVPDDLMERLRRFRQEHLLLFWDSLDVCRRSMLVDQLARIDLEQIDRLYAMRDQPSTIPPADRLAPVSMESAADVDAATIQLGHEAIARGELAVLLVAGGQGTRLGFEKPKGMFPIGPVSNKALFQIHAEKVYALGRRYGRPVPFLVMTSPATHLDTTTFFEEHRYFGLNREDVYFFEQGTMPAVDIETGRLLLQEPGILFSSPNGHGGTLTAVSESGLLDEIARRGVRRLFYFQVDNPLVKVGDPAFLGRHIALRSEVSSKAIEKAHAKERMGVLARIEGRCGIVEYSDLPEELATATDAEGQLLFRAGSPAIHLFDIDFLRRVTQGVSRLPFHIARKKVPHVSPSGETINPTVENALKFEMFIFDALPMADRWLVMESPRAEEFAPVKNADGADSPATARHAISNLAGAWLERVGAKVARDAEGNVAAALEISPRFALDADELKARVWPGRSVNSATYLE